MNILSCLFAFHFNKSIICYMSIFTHLHELVITYEKTLSE